MNKIDKYYNKYNPEACLEKWTLETLQLVSYHEVVEGGLCGIWWIWDMGVARHTRCHRGGWQICEMCACAHFVCSCMAGFSCVQYPSFIRCFVWIYLCISKHEIHIMLHCSLIHQSHWDRFTFSKQALSQNWFYSGFDMYLLNVIG